MKPGLRIMLLTVLPLLLLVMGCYMLLAVYYRDGFSFHTWINGVYCTGKTVEEINSELLSLIEVPNIVILDREENRYEISLEGTDYSTDFTNQLQLYMEQQNPFLWIDNLFAYRDHLLYPEVRCEEEELRKLWDSLPFVREESAKKTALEIQLGVDGYQLYDGLSGRLDQEKGFQLLMNTMEQGGGTIYLVENGCYTDYPLDEGHQETLALWEKVREFQECHIVYDMGDVIIPVNAGVACHFIGLDENDGFLLDSEGGLVLNEDNVEAFISELAEEYNTFGKEREFMATRGEVITVTGGTYGTLLDMETEIKYLTRAFLEKKEEVHVPVYKQEGEVRGKDDIGDTYIEIDMTHQKMYYYKDGECLVETEVVTGNTGRRMGTPQGVNYVYAKQKNRVLRGPGYASFVKFWMPVKGNIGIHDASWRSEFGREIYKTSGSHGCINTPAEQMELLYDLVEVGTPVIMFY